MECRTVSELPQGMLVRSTPSFLFLGDEEEGRERAGTRNCQLDVTRSVVPVRPTFSFLAVAILLLTNEPDHPSSLTSSVPRTPTPPSVNPVFTLFPAGKTSGSSLDCSYAVVLKPLRFDFVETLTRRQKRC